MLSALLRSFSATLLLGVAACTFGSSPVRQSSNDSPASKRRDAGTELDAASSGKRRASTRMADAQAEQDVDANTATGDVQQQEPATLDAGTVDRKPTAGSGASAGTVAQTAGAAGSQPADNQRADAGMVTMIPPAVDAGPVKTDASTDAGDPIGSLEDLAKMSPSERTSATINKFLTTLREGDAPASSIKEFLTSINDEVDCMKNPLSYECLTACRAVGTTCALCILEEECRMTLLDICGVTALRGCR